MGRNNTLATPEAYPAAFISIVEEGSGVIYTEDSHWAPKSTTKRFRLFIALLRTLPQHRLYAQANLTWHTVTTSKACNFRAAGVKVPSVSGVVVAASLRGD